MHAYGVVKEFALKHQPDEVWLFLNGQDLRANTPLETPPPFGPTFEYTDAQATELKDIRFGYVDPPAYTAWKRKQELGKFLVWRVYRVARLPAVQNAIIRAADGPDIG